MSDDDPFMVVKPDNENKRMSSYLKKNERGDRNKCAETSSHGTSSTRSTTNSTAQDDTTLFSVGKTPESKSKESTGAAFGGFGDSSAIEFNSDFGNGLEFGGFGGDDGFGTAPQPSATSKKDKKDSRDNKKEKEKVNESFDAFNPDTFGNSFGSDGFGGNGFGDTAGFGGGAFNERKESVNFGDDGFNAAFGEDSRSQQREREPDRDREPEHHSRSQQREHHSSKDEAWKKRETWKNQSRSNSSSSGHRRGGGHRRPPSRTASSSKGDSSSGMDEGSGHTDDSPRAPRSDRHMSSRGEGPSPDQSPRAPQSDRHLMSRGEMHADDIPRAPRSDRHMMSTREGHTDDVPRAPRSDRHMMSTREGSSADQSPRPPRSERLLGSRGERGERDRSPPHRGDRERSSPPPRRGDRSPVRRTRSGVAPRQRRATLNTSGAEPAEAPAPPQRGPPADPERGNVRPQRSRRRASLAYASKSDGSMDSPDPSPAPPQRHKSIDGIEPPMMDQAAGLGSNGSRVRPRRRGSVSALEAPGAFDPMQMNVPSSGPPKGRSKEFLRDRSDNQQKIMNMYKGGELSGDQKTKSERLDISIDTVPDASLGFESNGGGGGGGLGLGKMFGGKSKKADKLGDHSDHGAAATAGGFVIPDHEPPKRAPRRASLAFTRRKASEEPKEADYTENRNIEGRNRATLLERVAATGDQPSLNGDTGSEGSALSYSDRILGAPRKR
jgi:hypothetical protein